MCLVVRSNQRRTDPPLGRRKREDAVYCYNGSAENNDSLAENDDSLVENDDSLVENDDSSAENDDSLVENDDSSGENNYSLVENDDSLVENNDCCGVEPPGQQHRPLCICQLVRNYNILIISANPPRRTTPVIWALRRSHSDSDSDDSLVENDGAPRYL